jgi:predicted acyltransferase
MSTASPESAEGLPPANSAVPEGPTPDEATAPDEAASPEGPERLLSLDAFRGLTILGMLLVNNAGPALGPETPATLTHAPWGGGVYFADCVFPWFLFIVGVAIPWSLRSRKPAELPWWRKAWRIAGRAAALVALGCFIDSTVANRPVIGLGVLQLIGLAYALAAAVYRLPWWARLTLAATLLVGHWAAVRFIDVPGIGAGVFEEDRNLIQYLNDTYLRWYGLKGLVSVAPTGALAILGSLTGDLLRRIEQPGWRRSLWLLLAGGAAALLGWGWSFDLPYSKPLWTPPYILLTGGFAACLLAALYLIVDGLRQRWIAWPLIVPGGNALFAYVVPICVKIYVLQGWVWTYTDGTEVTLQKALLDSAVMAYGPITGGWVFLAGYVVAWWLVLLVLHLRRIHWRV